MTSEPCPGGTVEGVVRFSPIWSQLVPCGRFAPRAGDSVIRCFGLDPGSARGKRAGAQTIPPRFVPINMSKSRLRLRLLRDVGVSDKISGMLESKLHAELWNRIFNGR